MDAAGGAIGGSLAKPVLKGGGKLLRGTASYKARGGAISAISGREFVEVGSVMMTREILTKPVIKGQVKGAVAAHSAGYVYDYFRESSGSSAESYQQHSGPGGKPTFVPVVYTEVKRNMGSLKKGQFISQCPPGYALRKVKGKWVCALKSRKRRKR